MTWRTNHFEKRLKPWGEEQVWAKSDQYMAKWLIVKPGGTLSLQYHTRKHESLTLFSGYAFIQIGTLRNGDVVDPDIDWRTIGDSVEYVMEPGVTFVLEPMVVHRIRCPDPSSKPAQILEASTPIENDTIRLDDEYRRGSDWTQAAHSSQ